MAFLPQSPYPPGEFLAMVKRRFSKPQAIGDAPARVEIILDPHREPRQWIGFVGDICPIGQREARYASAVTAFFSDCELMVGNFEGVLTTGRRWPFLMKHTPPIFEALRRLRPGAAWVLSLANNHAADYGEEGLYRTIALIEAHEMRWLGTRTRQRIDLNPGITLTTWTSWVNGHSDQMPRQDPGAPAEAGLHIAFPHWGYEHERVPRPGQRRDLPGGYPLIVGHHSHLPQPCERLGEDRVVAWSLGNFVTGKRLPVLGEGALLKAGVAPDDEGVPRLTRVHYQRICLYRSDPRQCYVYPAGLLPSVDATTGGGSVQQRP